MQYIFIYTLYFIICISIIMYIAFYYNFSMNKCHKTARTSLPDDEHFGCSKHVEHNIIELNH